MNPELKSYLSSQGITELDLYIATQTNPAERYKIFTIKQGHKKRVIEEPIPELKRIQQAIVKLLENYPFHTACMARKGRNISDNANIHNKASNLLRIDIKQCYPSITDRLVVHGLVKYLPTLDYIVDIIKLCMIKKSEDLYILPTGAPSSPILCNIALTELDDILSALAEEYGYRYSRYIDDLHFSTLHPKRDWILKEKVEEIVHSFNLTPNYKKDKWFRKGHADKLIVTGVNLSSESKVPRSFVRMLRAKLQNLASNKKDLDPETKGCLAYVRSIDPNRYQYFIDYFQKRKDFNVAYNRVSSST